MTTRSESNCPHCGARVDPLRAGAVSIIEGRIVHFCSAACRTSFLKRATPSLSSQKESSEVSARPESSNLPLPEQLDAGETLDTTRSGDKPSNRKGNPVSAVAKVASPFVVEAAAILAALTAVLLLPRDLLGGLLAPGIATAVVLGGSARALFKLAPKSAGNIIEVIAPYLAASALVSASLLGGASKYPIACALAALAVDPLARIAEILGRSRSGVLNVVLGASGSVVIAAEWRDNSTTASKIRKTTLVLTWVRIPFAIALGALLWSAGVLSATGALAAMAGALLAINTRALRLITGDAHLSTAILAAKRGISIRDAHAVERLGTARIAAFLGKRTLVEPALRIVEWRVVPGFETAQVAARLSALESTIEGRFATAIRDFAVVARTSSPLRADFVESIPGVGVFGTVAGERVACGTRQLFIDRGISCAEFEPWASQVEASGRRALFVGVGDALAAMFAVEETPIPQAMEIVRELSMLGLEPALITSAELDAAKSLGARMGIDCVYFGVVESRMSEVLEAISAADDTVVLIGSGPAFEEIARSATASVAFASDGGTLADVDLKGLELPFAVEVITASRRAAASVRNNLAFTGASLGLCVGLAATWSTPGSTVAIAVLVATACIANMINRPFPWVASKVERISRFTLLVAKKARSMWGPAASK